MAVKKQHFFNVFRQLLEFMNNDKVKYMLLAVFTLNLAFVGLQTNFPLFSLERFDWGIQQNSYFYAYVGISAVIVQGILFRWFQPRLGERKLLFYGLSLMAIGLMGVALSTKAWMLYPLIGAVVIGSGVSIPSLSGLTSNQFPAALQGKLMGGYQSILSLANILGPSVAGVCFEVIDTSAPYWLGFMLSITTLLIVRYALTQLPASTSEVRSAPG